MAPAGEVNKRRVDARDHCIWSEESTGVEKAFDRSAWTGQLEGKRLIESLDFTRVIAGEIDNL